MDFATAAGIGGGLGIIVLANVLEGGNPMSLLALAPMVLVFGGSIGAAVAGGTIGDAIGAGKSLVKAFTWSPTPASELVPIVVSLADKARREGLLTLEDQVADVDDDFLKKGVSLAVDGTDPEELREILESEVIAKKAADKLSAKFFEGMGGYAPTVGIIGTVMGLVHVLENLSQPDKLGHLIAGAFIATLWGVLSANLIFLPVGNRLMRISQLETSRMEMVIEGVLAVQAGANPRVVAQRLNSLLPVNERDAEQKAA